MSWYLYLLMFALLLIAGFAALAGHWLLSASGMMLWIAVLTHRSRFGLRSGPAQLRLERTDD